MALTKEKTELVDIITEYGDIHIKEVTRVIEDGVVLSETFHRRVIGPDADVTGESSYIQEVKAASDKVKKPKPSNG